MFGFQEPKHCQIGDLSFMLFYRVYLDIKFPSDKLNLLWKIELILQFAAAAVTLVEEISFILSAYQ